jgi:hypothetical protein
MTYDPEKRCCSVCDAKKVCHVCGEQTLMACSDCRINLGATVYVCGKRKCREAHDRVCSGAKDRQPPGPMGTHSRGKISDDDEGDLRIVVTHNSEIVHIDFGEMGWVGFPPAQAVAFANLILDHAKKSAPGGSRKN